MHGRPGAGRGRSAGEHRVQETPVAPQERISAVDLGVVVEQRPVLVEDQDQGTLACGGQKHLHHPGLVLGQDQRQRSDARAPLCTNVRVNTGRGWPR